MSARIGRVAPRPAPRMLTPRQAQAVDAATQILDRGGISALSMRSLAEAMDVQAPSLYKHVDGKATLLSWIVERALDEVGSVWHALLDDSSATQAVPALLAEYRRWARIRPHRYRLVTSDDVDRQALIAGLEVWSGEPFFRATGEPHSAQALWAFAHGMAILEIDDRFLPGSALDTTWAAGAAAFSRRPLP